MNLSLYNDPRNMWDNIAFNELNKFPMIPAHQLAVGGGEDLTPQKEIVYPLGDPWHNAAIPDQSSDIAKTALSMNGALISEDDFLSDEFYLGGEEETCVI